MSMNNANYAIVRTGGKQYRVSAGDRIRVQKLETAPGGEVRFDVLFLKDGDNIQAGQPLVSGASVTAEIVRALRTKKVLVFKKRSKKGYKKLQGHRQNLTEILIKSIQAG